MYPRPLHKLAISVTTPIPQKRPLQILKTQIKGEDPVGMAISEGASQVVDDLGRKFGSPFMDGFMAEVQEGISKDAGLLSWWRGIGSTAAKAAPAMPRPALQQALSARHAPKAPPAAGVAPRLAPNASRPSFDEDPWGAGHHSEARTMARLEARRTKAPQAGPKPEWKPL